MTRRWLIGILALGLALGLVPKPPAPALAVPVAHRSAEGAAARTADVMREALLKFMENNYPSRVGYVVRSLQNREGALSRELAEAVRLVQELSRGPVTIEGDWQGSGPGRRYALRSIFRGVEGYPRATLIFHTYAGLIHPYIVVELDKDGDGKPEEQSAALCKREKMLEWLSERLPKAVCLARKK